MSKSYIISIFSVLYYGDAFLNTNASPVIPDGSGASQARALCQVTDDWSVQNAIVGQVFDTTASNTGRHKGASSRLEVLPGRPVMWLACRHLVGELHVFGFTVLAVDQS